MASKIKGQFVFMDQHMESRIHVKKQPTVIIYFRSRWGEIDGYLPTLKLLKERHPELFFFIILGNDRLAETIQEQPLLFSELKKISNTIVHLRTKGNFREKKNFLNKWKSKLFKSYLQKMTSLSWRPVLKELKKLNPILVIKDHVNDNSCLQLLSNTFHIPSVASPHGTGIFIEQDGLDYRKMRKGEVDLFLVGEESEIPWFKKTLKNQNNTRLSAVGRPRYDQWWIDHLSHLEKFKSSPEVAFSAQARRVYLFVTRGPSPIFFPKEVFREVVKEVMDTVLLDKDSVVLIKPHPQQNPEELQALLSSYDSSRWMISSLQTMQLAQMCDLTLCMVSSVILDCLAVKKPVIEYFRYTTGEHIFKKNLNGETVSNYTELGLAIPADNPNTLNHLIEEYFSSTRPEKWTQQYEIARHLLRLDNKASIRSVEEIEQLLKHIL